MSFNQSRSDKNDNTAQFNRKLGRSSGSYQRSYSSGRGGGSGGPAPTPSSNPPSSNRPTQSYRKTNNAPQGQGGQSRINVPAATNSESNNANAPLPRTIQNGAHPQPPLQGATDEPIIGVAPRTTEASSTQRSSRADVPKAPSSQSATPAKLPTTPIKPVGLQFGSISPGFVHGMQIPARTSSAPPNLDEQKCDQARNDSYRSVPSVPIPSVPKPQLPGKDANTAIPAQGAESHSIPKVKNEVQVSSTPPSTLPHKLSAVPLSGMPMQVPFHQPQGPVQFGGPNPQVQSQGLPATSLHMQMSIPLSMGNAAQVPQQVFLQGGHPMQHQGIIHQGQNMGFTPQMGSQLPHQLGNMGMNINPQFPQQQGGKFGGPRKVKITHPDTHEELRLDKGSPGQRSHPNMPTQAQPVPTYFYQNPYSSPLYFSPNAVPLTSTQVNPSSQASRFIYPVSQNTTLFANLSAPNSLPGNKMGIPGSGEANLGRTRDVHSSVSSALPSTAQVSVKPAAGSGADKVADASHHSSSAAAGKSESPKLSRPPEEASSISQRDSDNRSVASLSKSKPASEVSASATISVVDKQSVGASGAVPIESLMSDVLSSPSAASSDGSMSVLTSNEGRRKGSRTNTIKEQQKKPGKKGYAQLQQSASVVPAQSADHSASSSGASVTSEEKPNLSSLETPEGVSESSSEALSSAHSGAHDVSESKSVVIREGSTCGAPQMFGVENTINAVNDAKKHEFKLQDEQSNYVAKSTTVIKAQDTEEDKIVKVVTTTSEIGYLVVVDKDLDDSSKLDSVSDDSVVSTCLTSDLINAEPSLSASAHDDKVSALDASLRVIDNLSSKDITESIEVDVTNSGLTDLTAPVQTPNILDESCKDGAKDIVSSNGSKDKLAIESNRAKSTAAPKRKKMKEILQKADAAGTTSDLYMAYKGPEEKDILLPSESTDSASTETELKGVDTASEDLAKESGSQGKFEPDDWEDAADIATPKLEASENGELGRGGLTNSDRDGSGVTTKKYSRDFLLKFAELCNSLPENFNIAPNIAAALMVDRVSASHYVRDSFPSPGRAMDRPTGAPWLERRGSNVGDDEKWKQSPQLDLGYGSNLVGFRPGVLRNPRVQSPIQYPSILSGPLQSMGSMQRSNSDADKWQRATSKGLIPSPQAPSPAIHKAEKKYEVGKVTDEEQAKQRQLKGILNKLTPQNFEKLFQQVKAVNIDSAITLTGVISQIFDKALMEPTFCEMYADFCYHLAGELPNFREGEENITFKRVLLNKCQEEFERGEREQEEANRVEEGEITQSEEEREEKRVQARRRMLGNIRLIGELYKKRMLTEKIMHECIKKLLGQYQNPDEEDIEALCKLMSTIGEMIDHPKAKGHMDAYFEMMAKLSTNMKLSSRVRFMLQDAIDLRSRKWQQRRKIEGPKKIEEVHRDAAHERQAQSSRLARGPGINPSARRGAPMDFGPRGSSMLSSPNAQMGGFRGYPTQVRGFGNQDIRMEERQYERTLSVPLPQRSVGDETITLGPQGGLARGMSIRGPSSMLNVPIVDRPHSSGDSRRAAFGLNGYSSGTEGTSYNFSEDTVQRYAPERFVTPSVHDQSGGQERSIPSGNRDLRDRSFDRSSLATSPPTRVLPSASVQTVPPEKVWPEERLRDMSIATIKEFYSAKDEKEVALCIRDLKSRSFYPSMIALWVTDSFERKDMESDLLARLLVNLTKAHEGLLSRNDLLGGFETALTALEDAVNDAPRAPEFLGRIFAKVIVENVIPLRDIGQIIHRGGEEPGSLLRIGLAGDVLGSVLEMIQSEKGDSVLNEIRSSSNLQLEDFKPPGTKKSRKLEKFI